jgi:hypothetical protein
MRQVFGVVLLSCGVVAMAGDFSTNAQRLLPAPRVAPDATQWSEMVAAANDLKTQTTGWITVRAYGALGDGHTDDTAAIRAALSATMSNGGPANGGRAVLFDAGTYRVTGSLTVGSNHHIVFRPGTSIRAAFPDENTSLFVISGQANVTVEGNGATLVGSRSTARPAVEGRSAAFFVYGSRNVSIRNLTVQDFATDGITLTGDDTGSGPCRNVHLENVVAAGNRRNGLSVISARGVRVVGGEFTTSSGAPHGPWAGIDIEPNANSYADDVTLIGVNTSGNAGAGIQITPGALGSGSARRFHLTIDGGRSDHDGSHGSQSIPALYFVNGDTPKVRIPGEVSVRDFLISDPIGSGVRFRNWDDQMSPAVLLERVVVANPDSTGKAIGGLDRSAFVIYADSAQSAGSVGNLVLRECHAEDLRRPPRMVTGCIVGADKGKIVRNVRIEDQRLSTDGGAGGPPVRTQVGATSVLDGVDISYSRASPTWALGSESVGDRGGQRLLIGGPVTLTLPPASSCRGLHYEFMVSPSEGARIAASGPDRIVGLDGRLFKSVDLGRSGGATLRSNGGTWSVEASSGAITFASPAP